jgi:hypothetical protein
MRCYFLLVQADKGEHELNKEQDPSSLFCHTMEILNDAGDKSAYLSGDVTNRPNHFLEKVESPTCSTKSANQPR